MHMHVHNMHMRIQKNISRGSKGYFSLQGGMSFFWLRISGGGGGGWGRGGLTLDPRMACLPSLKLYDIQYIHVPKVFLNCMH